LDKDENEAGSGSDGKPVATMQSFEAAHRGDMSSKSLFPPICAETRTSAWLTQVTDHMVPNRVSRAHEIQRKSQVQKRFGMRELQKSQSAQIQRI
jgi:hypothetical protein